jgi:putative SOS response-associated peptidase YedK
MCGRYTFFRSVDEIRRAFGTVGEPPEVAPTWNMAPSRLAPVVRRHPESGARHLDLLRWGLVPHWAKHRNASSRPINARCETVASAPMFRDAYARRRCIVPVDAFYEWKSAAGHKLPYAVARADGAMLALGGLWEGWRGADGEVERTFTILTTPASVTLAELHQRMPLVLEPAAWPAWLGESEGDVAALLVPSAAAFRTWPVATLVNDVRNDGPHLLDPSPSLV